MIARFRMAYGCSPGQFTVAVFFGMLEEATAARRWLDGKVSDDEAGSDNREEGERRKRLLRGLMPHIFEVPADEDGW